jgi:hypothetical protein
LFCGESAQADLRAEAEEGVELFGVDFAVVVCVHEGHDIGDLPGEAASQMSWMFRSHAPIDHAISLLDSREGGGNLCS